MAELVIVQSAAPGAISARATRPNTFRLLHRQRLHARDLQARSSQWLLGKSLGRLWRDRTWLVTADQVDGDKLDILAHRHGEKRQSSNTSDLLFNCKQLISYISDYTTLKPATSSFHRHALRARDFGYPADKRVWLKPGDKVGTSIEKLGDLAFTLT